MTKLILSTSNLINGASSVFRRPTTERSNVELVNGLRSNLLASKQEAIPQTNGDSCSPDIRKASSQNGIFSEWVRYENGEVFVPSVDFSQPELAEARSQYQITAKLFFLRNTTPCDRRSRANEAVSLVLKQLGMPSLDLLIVSFPGISYDDTENDCADPLLGKTRDNDAVEDMNSMIETWRSIEHLQENGKVSRLGIAEFCEEKLQQFLPHVRIRPTVDQVNLKDICFAPKVLMDYAKQEKLEVWPHNDCTNILPSGTLRELLGTGKNGAGLILGPNDTGIGLRGDIRPQWVIKYTAIVRDRGVIENKGYFAMAEINE